jgi:GntR family transcriptional regulator
LDFSSGLPAYLQIVRRLERQATSGRLHPGDQLPTVRGLADDLGLNFNTVARAYRLLQQAGVVSAQRGRGTYVIEQAAAHAGRRTRTQTLEAITRQYVDQARGYKFSDAEIAAAVDRRLAARTPRRAGRGTFHVKRRVDSHG